MWWLSSYGEVWSEPSFTTQRSYPMSMMILLRSSMAAEFSTPPASSDWRAYLGLN